MQHYRAFELDFSGHVIGRIDLSCADDEDAKTQAVKLVQDHDIEVWRLNRRVVVLKSENKPK